MTFYRKKPVVIEAVEFSGIVDTGFMGLHGPAFKRGMPKWLKESQKPAGSFLEKGEWTHDEYKLGGVLHIGTLEGVMTALPGDFIIRGVHGEIYPCKPDIFAITYEEVE